MAKGFMGLIWCFVLTVVILTESASAVTYTVGDTLGWTVPPNTSFYSDDWAHSKTFLAGDILSFNWTTSHDVANVTEDQYKQCEKVNQLVGSNSPVLVTLTAGTHYFICTVGTHCQSGQKLKVEVASSNATTPGSPPSTLSPPPPPPPSSSPSFAPFGTVSAAISVLAFSFLT
ncbi:Blue (type 1) copper protein, binding site [Trema orientale]|uniref:Blue (Type 1) copper protein, binding site n=1 Tax=Trema orientale TaxID=63057 RepID=A0A2P5F8Z0_TREOI|nr:Blue (type 1) copper protein, binding site [Trema orientale]